MPKQKDPVSCNLILKSNDKLKERIVLYEDCKSEDVRIVDKQNNNTKFPFAPQQNDDTKEEIQFGNNARDVMFRGFLSAIYDCMEELTILKRFCRRATDPSWIEPLQYKPMEQLYNNPDESYDMYKLDDMKKSLKDICVLFNILSNSYQEIQKDQTFTVLEKSVDVLTRHIQDELNLMDELHFMCKYKEYLKVAFIKEKTVSKEQLLHLCDKTYSLKIFYEHILANERSQYYYNSDWETARLEQKCWSVSKETQTLKDSIKKCIENMANENRVHNEMEKYCTEYGRDLNKQINDWQDKYERELENEDSELIHLKNENEMLILQRADLKVLYDERNKQMEEWIEYRTKKKAADDYTAKLDKAATKIQAWWRGQLYRRQLGPYRKKKGKKGKGASKAGRKNRAKAKGTK